MSYEETTETVRTGPWDPGREVTRITLHRPRPHPLNEAWQYDPDSDHGIVVDARGRQVGVDFGGRVHDEHGRELDSTGTPIAEADGTPLPPPARLPHSGRPLSTRKKGDHGPSRSALARKYPALNR